MKDLENHHGWLRKGGGVWVANLVAHLLSTAALLVRIQTKNTKYERHKQRSGQHTLARQKIYKKSLGSNISDSITKLIAVAVAVVIFQKYKILAT